MMFNRFILSVAAVAATCSIAIVEAQEPSLTPRSIDIGPVGTAGSFSTTESGGFIVSGAGRDIWSSSDSFNFLYFNKTTSEDLTMTVLVNSFSGSESWSKGGLMIRDSLEPNSAHAMIQVTGWGGIAHQGRASTGSSSTSKHASYTNEDVWLRLVKHGNTLTSYTMKKNEYGFKRFHTTTITFTGDEYYVGIAVVSKDTGKLATLDTTSFDLGNSGEVFSLPSQDIGVTGREVTAQEINAGVWEIKGAGTGIGGTADSFAFFGYKQSSDVTTTLYLEKLQVHSDKLFWNSSGGLMMRASQDPKAPHASLLTTFKDGITMVYRSISGGETITKNVGVWSQDMELKLEKIGNTVVCKYKHDSQPDWFHIGTADVDFGEVGDDYYVGQAVSSAYYGRHTSLRTGPLHVDNVPISPAME